MSRSTGDKVRNKVSTRRLHELVLQVFKPS